MSQNVVAAAAAATESDESKESSDEEVRVKSYIIYRDCYSR